MRSRSPFARREHGVEQGRPAAQVLVEPADAVLSHPLAEHGELALQRGEAAVAVGAGRAVRRLGQLIGRDVEEPRQRSRLRRAGVGGHGEAGEEEAPLPGCRCGEHRARAGTDGRNAPLTQHGGGLGGPPLRRHEDADVGGLHPSGVTTRPDAGRVEQRAHPGGDIGEHETRRGSRLHRLGGVGDARIVWDDAQVDGGLAEGVGVSSRAGIDAGELDVGMAEAGAVEQHGDGVEQLPVGAVVRPQRRA